MKTIGWLALVLGLLAHPLPLPAQTLADEFGAAGGAAGARAAAPPAYGVLQAREDAWWTGPMMANSAETLTPGHFLFEPYFYEVRAAHWKLSGSSAYLLYGLVDDFTAGVVPVVGYREGGGSPSSSHLAVGDIALSAQYRLRRFHEGSWLPTIALNVQQTLPTGKYDRLGNRPNDGLGSGVYATMVALNSQSYFWLPNGRILRTRLDLSQTFVNGNASVSGVSVYGTDDTFTGHARPGGTFLSDLAFEYSVTQRWVAALDLLYTRQGSTRVSGHDAVAAGSGAVRIPASASYGFAPAVEWNMNANLGVLLGLRVLRDIRNSTNTVTPALAINYVH
jgi:hypothetical protein